MVSQHDAVTAVSKAIRKGRAGLKTQPPHGLVPLCWTIRRGQDVALQALTEFMFGDTEHMIHLDMSEYMEKHSVSRLVSALPVTSGTKKVASSPNVRRKPYSVILLDEVEKAHPDVFNMMLQIMEEGHLTDSFGRKVDFRNTVVIMTSNIEADIIKGGSSFGFGRRDETPDYDGMKLSSWVKSRSSSVRSSSTVLMM